MKSMLLRRRIMLGLASSPFSPEATAILKEDFPNEWNDIKAYGYANPKIVPYINEDPYIICSLINVGVTRWLINDEQGLAYIDTNIKGNRNTEIEAKFKIGKNNSCLAITIFGTWIGGQTESNAITPLLPLQGTTANRMIRFGARMNEAGLSPQYSLNTVYIMKQNKEGVWMDGTKVISYNQTLTFTTPGTITFFRIKGALDTYNCLSGHLAYAKLGGDYPREMYPFVRNNVNGMIDILSNTFYPNANNSGAFTISIEQNS